MIHILHTLMCPHPRILVVEYKVGDAGFVSSTVSLYGSLYVDSLANYHMAVSVNWVFFASVPKNKGSGILGLC